MFFSAAAIIAIIKLVLIIRVLFVVLITGALCMKRSVVFQNRSLGLI